MKIKLNSDDKLCLNTMIEIPSMMIVVRAIFMKIFPQVFLDECLYNFYFILKKNLYYDRIDISEEININKTRAQVCCLSILVFLKL